MTELLSPVALYAETHFRFFGCSPSALFRREPEIVFDMPRRVGRGYSLPVMLLINDIRKYPVRIVSIQIAVSASGDGGNPRLFEFDPNVIEESAVDHPLRDQTAAYVLTIPRDALPTGAIYVNACLRYRRIKNGAIEKNLRAVMNDNLATSSKYGFKCIVSENNYPGGDMCVFGDAHCHSLFSRSHVEWGPPPELIGIAASVGGLDFAAVTDHSYDLACEMDNYLRQDKELRLWKLFRQSIDNYNRSKKYSAELIPGEEVSVLNSIGQVVHLCGLGVSEYIPGTLDGARKNTHFKKQLSVEEAVLAIERQGGVSFAAHPGADIGVLQRLFLNRGDWGGKDICEKLDAVQIVNEGFGDTWRRGKEFWISALQKGLKVPALAGSDAHGDFNRYRAIAVPFWRVYEDMDRYMGFARTGIYGKRGDIGGVMDGIKNGATFVTNGPFATICDAQKPDVSLVGKTRIDIKNNAASLQARAVSGDEFGTINVVKAIVGRPGVKGEKILVEKSLPPECYDVSVPIPTEDIPDSCYLRVDIEGKTRAGGVTYASTSACFIGL